MKKKKLKKPARFGQVHGGADSFAPHDFQTRLVHNFAQPQILITPEAYADMIAIADNSGGDEIGWLGTVTELGDAKYLVDGVYLFEQQVNPVTNELTEDGLSSVFTELAATDFSACERMHFWGHVHPGNSTSPSQQDEDQMNQFAHNDWFLRGIFGRQGRAEFTFFDYKNGIRWNDCPWQIHVPVSQELKAKWAAEVAEKVSPMPVSATPKGAGNFNQYQGGRQWRR